jgi:hypothetical protein
METYKRKDAATSFGFLSFSFFVLLLSLLICMFFFFFFFHFSVSGSQWEDQAAAVGTGFLLGRVAVEGRMVELLVIFLVVAERGRGCGQWFQVGSGGGAGRTRRTDPGFMRSGGRISNSSYLIYASSCWIWRKRNLILLL